MGTRRLYLARNPPPCPPAEEGRMFLPRAWPAGARCGGLLLSSARPPGPRGRLRLSRARASCSLGRRGQRRQTRLDGYLLSPPPPLSRSWKGPFVPGDLPVAALPTPTPQSLSGDQTLSVLHRLGEKQRQRWGEKQMRKGEKVRREDRDRGRGRKRESQRDTEHKRQVMMGEKRQMEKNTYRERAWRQGQRNGD